MYHILIVDDHVDQREFLQFLLNNHPVSFQITESVNGKEALALCSEQAFDFIITDVKMPFLSGIEFAEALRQKGIQIPILFISGYDDFNYVKKALTLQAIDYLLKPINPQEFNEQIDLLIQRVAVDKERQQHLIDIKQLQQQKMITNLLHGISCAQLNISEQKIAQDVFDRSTFIFLIESEPEQITSLIHSLKDNDPKRLLHHRVSSSRVVLFYFTQNLATALKKIQLVEQHLTLQTTGNYTIERSNLLTSPDELFSAYQLLETQLTHRFYEQAPNPSLALQLPTANPIEELALIKELKDLLRQSDFLLLKEKIDSLLKLYHQAAYESPMLTKFFFANLFKTILEASNFVLETKQVQLQQLLQVKKFSDIAPFLDNLLQKLTARQEVINDDGNDYVREAKKYILNYYNQELNLEAIASTINISPKYLSDLFIREEGIGISKYLKQIRMEKAQDLLQNSTLRVGEISDQVGFSSHSYFIRNFRELFQMTPDAYRKMNRQVKK